MRYWEKVSRSVSVHSESWSSTKASSSLAEIGDHSMISPERTWMEGFCPNSFAGPRDADINVRSSWPLAVVDGTNLARHFTTPPRNLQA
ncbi:hypothetical protein D3C87_1666370 [compost metagenome]